MISALKYYAIIVVFICGALGGFLAAGALGVRAVWIALVVLLFVFLLLWQRPINSDPSIQHKESEAHT